MTFRLAAAFAAVVFAVASGMPSMEAHQLAAHGTSRDAAAALQQETAAHADNGHAHAHHGEPQRATAQDADGVGAHDDSSGRSSHSGHPCG